MGQSGMQAGQHAEARVDAKWVDNFKKCIRSRTVVVLRGRLLRSLHDCIERRHRQLRNIEALATLGSLQCYSLYY